MKEKYKCVVLDQQAEIFTFAAGIQKNELLPVESKELSRYLHASQLAVYAAKSMKDVRHNFDDLKKAENDFVQEEYLRLTTELISFFAVVISLLEDSVNKEKIKTLLRLFKKLEESEEAFIGNALKAVQKKTLAQREVATLLVVNRAYEQASYQLLSAVREAVLTDAELQYVDELQEILESND